MSKVLVTFSADWADELQAEGFQIYDKIEWETMKEAFLKKKSFSWYFGTNEGWENEDPKEFIGAFDEKDISDEEEAVINRLFPRLTYGFGQFPNIEDLDDDEDDY